MFLTSTQTGLCPANDGDACPELSRREDELALHNFRARFYDSDIMRFYAVDPAEQTASPYLFYGNNPVMYVDEDGELAFLIPIIAGAVINAATNASSIDWSNPLEGLGQLGMYAGVGALSGAASMIPGAGSVVAGAVSGIGNGLIQGKSGGELALSGMTGALSSGVGSAMGSLAQKTIGNVAINGLNITSPVIKGIVGGTIGGVAGGYAGGFASGYIISGGDVNAALSAANSGALTGGGLGAVTGGVAGYKYAKDNNIDPWRGTHKKSISIGEVQKNVDDMAKDLNTETISPAWEKKFGNARVPEQSALGFNEIWITEKIALEYKIYDRGPVSGTSKFYNVEQQAININNYKRNVIHVRYIYFRQIRIHFFK